MGFLRIKEIDLKKTFSLNQPKACMREYRIKQIEKDDQETKVTVLHNENEIGVYKYGPMHPELVFEPTESQKHIGSFEINPNDEEFFVRLLKEYETNKKYGECPDITPPRITTMTLLYKLETKEGKNPFIHLDTLFKCVKLDKQVYSVKSSNQYRNFQGTKEPNKKQRKPKTKKTLYNQVTLVIYIDPDRDKDKAIKDREKINVKIFKNGAIQMTGVRFMKSADMAITFVVQKINQINSGIYLPVETNENGLVLDDKRKVYGVFHKKSAFFGKLIGYYQNDVRTKRIDHKPKLYFWDEGINGYTTVVPKGTPCSESVFSINTDSTDSDGKDKEYQKKVFDNNGVLIGKQTIEWNQLYLKNEGICLDQLDMKIQESTILFHMQNRKRVKWTVSDTHSAILDKDGFQIGKIKSHFQVPEEKDPFNGKLLVKQQAVFKNPELVPVNRKIGMINAVFSLNLGDFHIILNNLNRLLVYNYGVKSRYDPGGDYLAVNLKYAFNLKNKQKDGVCYCMKKACEHCQHNKKHEKFCQDCENTKHTGNLCNSCMSCEMCIHQSSCDVKKCKQCNCFCDPCDCVLISVLCFHTGKIIITGARSEEQMNEVYSWFTHVIQKHYLFIVI